MSLSEKQLNFVLMPFDHTLDVAEGTPRSGKTTAAVLRFYRFLNTSTDENFLIVAASAEQAFRLVMDADGNGLLHLFGNQAKLKHDDYGDHLEALTVTGTKKIYYKGGAKVDSDKGIRGLSLGGVMFCEIDILHMNMIQECLRRTYAAQIRWHIADLNPPAPQHPVIKDVFEVQNTNWSHWTVQDNPIITDERKQELEETLKKNPYLYKRDWLGERCIPEGVIYSMFDHSKHILKAIPKEAQLIEMYFSGDGGLTDATSVACNIVGYVKGEYVLYRVANWYYDGKNKAMSVQAKELATEFANYCREKYHMYESFWAIDPACKALRKELEMFDLDVRNADNNGKDIKGNVKGIRVGIEYAQNMIQDGHFYLVEADKYGHDDYLKELSMYCVDQHGNPIDMYNHSMDDFRYSINYFAKNYIY